PDDSGIAAVDAHPREVPHLSEIEIGSSRAPARKLEGIPIGGGAAEESNGSLGPLAPVLEMLEYHVLGAAPILVEADRPGPGYSADLAQRREIPCRPYSAGRGWRSKDHEPTLLARETQRSHGPPVLLAEFLEGADRPGNGVPQLGCLARNSEGDF